MIKSKNMTKHIFEYTDYRQYLLDYYTLKKSNNPSYSHRVFAKQAGLSSPSHLLMIIKGERNLSQKTVPKFVDGLKLSQKEAKFFELMVLFAQTEDLEMKSKYFAEIISIKSTLATVHNLEKEKFDFLSKWYVVAIYVLIDTRSFNPNPNWIARRLGNRITPTQAAEALQILLRLEMIEVDSERSSYKQKLAGALSVRSDARSMAVYEYHQSMNRLASDALRQNPPSTREINSATISIPKDKLSEIQEKIRAFRKEINQIASAYTNPDDVYQMNIQLFALTTGDVQ